MKTNRSNLAVYVLFLLSGCAALIYEVLWTRQLTLILGGTTYAVTTVIVSFMSGLGLGSHLAGRRSASLRQPGRAYAVLEVAIGACAMLVPFLMGTAEPLYRALYPNVFELPGLLTAARFCVSALVLIVPTTLMGATFPLLVTHVTRAGLALGQSTALLYGINTCGATLGALLAGFWLIPTFGLTHTTWITAAMNLAIGVLGWFVLSGRPQAQPPPHPAARPADRKKTRKEPRPAAAPPHPSAANLVLLVAGISGLASMIYQIAWTRSLIMSIGSSTYSFTCILSAFILGLGAGSLLTARFTDRLKKPVTALAWMEFGIGLSAVLILPIHGRIPSIVKGLVVAHGQDYSQLLTLEFMLIVGVTLVPTLLMGAAFPLMARIVGLTHDNPGLVVGRVYVINTIGAIVGAFLAGFVLIRGEVLGIQYTIVAGALANALAATALLVRARPPTWTRARVAATAGAGILVIPLVALASGKWDRTLLASAPFNPPKTAAVERHVLFFREDVETTVALLREGDDENSLSLTVNGKPDASTNLLDIRTQLLLGYVPALMDRNAKQACIIGLGSGMTLSAVARFPSYEQLDCLEISPAVIEAAGYFAPYINNVLTADPRVRLIRADGRNHLLLTDQQYDLIVSEPSNPWIAGVSSLFSREFFEVCKRRLRPEGVLAVWTHSYSMSLDDFRMIVRTLADVFDAVTLWELADADYCLIAGSRPFAVPLATLMERYSRPDVRADLYRAGIRDLAGLLGTFVAGGRPLRDWAASAPVNTDDNSRLEFSTPRHLYDDQVLRIAAELNRLQGSPLEHLATFQPDDPAVAPLKERIAAVVDARHAFMRGLSEWRAGNCTQGLGTLLAGCDRDAGNVLIAYVLGMAVQSAQSPTAVPADQRESLRPLLERAVRLPRPVVAPRRGASIPQLVAWSREAVQECIDRKEFALAAAYLGQAFSLAPDDGTIASNLALALLQIGRPERAEAVVNDFLQRHPEDGWVNYAAGRLALSRRNSDACLAYLEKALKSGSVQADWLAKIPDLEPLRKDDRLARLLARFPASQPTTP